MSKLSQYLVTSKRAFSILQRRFSKADERTFIMLKPDAVQRLLIGEVINRLEKKGFKLIAIKIVWASEQLIKDHYKEIVDQSFFSLVMKYMRSGPVVPMIWEGRNIVKAARILIGKTTPLENEPGSIRGDFCMHPRRNLIHGSSCVEEANKEIKIWFTDEEHAKWDMKIDCWIHE